MSDKLLNKGAAGSARELSEIEKKEIVRRALLDLQKEIGKNIDPKLYAYLSKPENVELVLACIEQQPNGDWRVMPRGVQMMQKRLRVLDVRYDKRVETLKKSMTDEIDKYLGVIENAKKALKDAEDKEKANGGSQLSGDPKYQTLKTNVDALVANRDTFIAQHTALIDAANEIMSSSTKMVAGRPVTDTDLQDALVKIFSRAWPAGQPNGILSLVRNTNTKISATQEQDLLDALIKESILSAFTTQAQEKETKDVLSGIDSALVTVDIQMIRENMKKFEASERYNNQLGGTVPGKILGRCIIEQSDDMCVFSIDILDQQLRAIGLEDAKIKTITGAVGAELVKQWPMDAAAGGYLLTHPFVPSAAPPRKKGDKMDWKKWESDMLPKLIPLVRNNGFDQNPGGISLDHMQQQVDEQLILSEWLMKIINRNVNATGPQWAGIAGEIKALGTLVIVIDSKDLEKAAALVTGDSLIDKPGPLINFVSKKIIDKLDELDRTNMPKVADIQSIVTTNKKFRSTADKWHIANFVKEPQLKGFTEDQLRQFLGNVKDGDAVPPGFDSGPLERYILEQLPDVRKKLRREQLLKDTGVTKVPAAPFRDKALGYLHEGERLAGVGFDRWWAWMSSMPENFKSNPELQKQLDRRAALREARATVDGLLQWGTTDGKTKDDINKSPNAKGIKQTLEDIKVLQSDLVAANKDMEYARNPQELNKQIRMLAEAGMTVMAELESKGLRNITDPVMRRTAFAIAMELENGMDIAVKYITSPDPQAFLVALTSGVNAANGVTLLEYQDRWAETKRAGGTDILRNLIDLGIGVHTDASQVLAEHNDPATGKPFSVGETRPENWMTNPQRAEPALRLILYEDKDFVPRRSRMKPVSIDDLMDAFVNKKDVQRINPATGAMETIITSFEAIEAISRVQQRLLMQGENAQLSEMQLLARERGNSPLNFFRAGTDAVGKMMKSRDPVEKALGFVLAGGALYAVYASWKKGGLSRGLVVGIPMFFGADIALKRMTGSGLLDRLGLTYMNEKDRGSALEEFLRRSAKEDRYAEFMKKPEVGRECVRQLTGLGQRVPMERLLAWREQIHANGKTDYRAGAPDELNPNAIIKEMGTLDKRGNRNEVLQQKAYEYLYLTLEALCSDVASANGLGGTSVYDRANLGAMLIQKRYVTFTEDYQKVTGLTYKNINKKFSFLDVLVFERPTPAMRDALKDATILEWAAAKLGMTIDWVKEKWMQGYSFIEMKALAALEAAPGMWRGGVQVLSDSWDVFYNWARTTGFQVGKEFERNLPAAWNVLSNIFKTTKLTLKVLANGVLEWSCAAPGITKDVALNVWRELHRHHISGPILEAFEAFLARTFGLDVMKQHLLEKLAEIDEFKKDLADIMNAAGVDKSTKKTDVLITGWLETLGIKDNSKSPAERMVNYELLRRSVNAFILSTRILSWQKNKGASLDSPLELAWPEKIDTNGRFDGGDATYKYCFYLFERPDGVMKYMGRDQTINGWLAGNASGSGVAAGASNVAYYFLSFFLYDKAIPDYIRNDLKVLEDTIKAESETLKADPARQRRYEAYARSLLMNVLVETAILSNPDGGTPPHVTVDCAQGFYRNVLMRRTKMLDHVQIDPLDATLKKFDVPAADEPEALSKLFAKSDERAVLQGYLGTPDPTEPVKPGAKAPVKPAAPAKPKGGAAAEPKKPSGWGWLLGDNK